MKTWDEQGRIGGPRPTDVDLLDGHQGFLDWRITTGEKLLATIRLGNGSNSPFSAAGAMPFLPKLTKCSRNGSNRKPSIS
jgi:hypothetical protein